MNIMVRKVGNSKGVILPQEVLKQLSVNEGDCFKVTVEHGKIILEPFDQDFKEQLELADRFMSRYETALTKLAE